MRLACVALSAWALALPVVAGTHDLPDGVRPSIGVLVTGVQSPGGLDAAVVRGINQGVADWNRGHPARAPVADVVLISASTRWDSQTSDIVQSVFSRHLPVLIGATDRRTAHLAGQVVTRLKGSTLLLAICSDETLTRIGVPWILRMWVPTQRAVESPPEAALEPEILARDAGFAVVDSIAAAGADALRILEYLETKRFPSELGEFRFDRSGNRVPVAGK